jgi:hypothetical protein
MAESGGRTTINAEEDAQAEHCLQYFHNDFLLEEWISEASIKFVLPSIQSESLCRIDSTTELRR